MNATPSTGEHAQCNLLFLRIGCLSRQRVSCHQHHPEKSTNVPLLPLEADIASDGSNKSAKCHNEPLAAQAFGGDSNSAGQLRRDLCDMLALVARAIKLVGARLA